MAERIQSSEARSFAVFYRDSVGAPVTGLTPTGTARYKDGTAGAPAVTATEIGGGFYRIGLASVITKDLVIAVDGGGSLTTTRYIGLEVPVGGYVDSIDAATSTRAAIADYTSARAAKLDNLDATTSSRSSQASVTALGSPAQATALATAQADLTTLLGRLTATRAGLLDNLALLDVAISSRATHAEATGDTAGTTTLLSRLTSIRAGLLDNLTRLDVAVSSVSGGGGSSAAHVDIS